jgi:uncharacterized protein
VNKKVKSLIDNMVEKLRICYQPEKIILFGSYANGKPTDDSDVDLFIIKDDPQRSIDRSIQVRRILREENREIALTSLVFTPKEVEYRLYIGDDFVQEILDKGIVLYAK